MDSRQTRSALSLEALAMWLAMHVMRTGDEDDDPLEASRRFRITASIGGDSAGPQRALLQEEEERERRAYASIGRIHSYDSRQP